MTKKKTFKDNPAMQFISAEQEVKEESNNTYTHTHTDTAKLKPIYVETKSRRVYLLMQPSLHKRVQKLAKTEGISLNEYIHKALEDYTSK